MDTEPFDVRAWAVYICLCVRNVCVYTGHKTQKANANVITNERK